MFYTRKQNIYIFLIIYLAVPSLRCGTQDLQSSLWHERSFFFFSSFQLWHVGSSSLSRDQVQAPCIGSPESQPLNLQGSPRKQNILFTEIPEKPGPYPFSQRSSYSTPTRTATAGDLFMRVYGNWLPEGHACGLDGDLQGRCMCKIV